jgi:4-alpha-glucanotransferase
MLTERLSGILLHPTSLPSSGGIGDLGPAAYEFIDFLREAKQGLWQVLPLSPVGMGYSPYSATSAFAGNPLLISLEALAKHAWIDVGEVHNAPAGGERIDFEEVVRWKLPLLRKAAKEFLSRPPDEFGERARFEVFTKENLWWLEDFVLFNCLRERFDGQSWNLWPKKLAQRDPFALEEARTQLRDELQIERVIQFAFYEQWKALHRYCRDRSIKIVGDVAIFVNFDSADVWSQQHLFFLDEGLEPTVVSGVPPDAFSETGQRWGNPLYDWEANKRHRYEWWIRRMRWATTTCDIVRIDHFRGFAQYWEIPASEETAINGKWIDGPNDDLFLALRAALGNLPFIAEDLGLITQDVTALRERLGIPGMKVLQFGFGDKGAHIYLPHRYERNCVAYTGTHDNDTTIGWWDTLDAESQRNVTAYLGEANDGISWSMIRVCLGSPAQYAIVPLQDALELDSSARMNTPSLSSGNWGWRYEPFALTSDLATKLAAIVDVTDREPTTSTAGK